MTNSNEYKSLSVNKRQTGTSYEIKAEEYLIKKGYKITAIYGLCGYDDFTTFYRNFKKIIGVSPKEYKNKI